MTIIAEVLLRIAFHIANPFTQRGENLRWAVQQYFYRFKFCPAPRRATVIEEYGPAAAANSQEGGGDGN